MSRKASYFLTCEYLYNILFIVIIIYNIPEIQSSWNLCIRDFPMYTGWSLMHKIESIRKYSNKLYNINNKVFIIPLTVILLISNISNNSCNNNLVAPN